MKVLIAILVLFAFLQSTIVPLDLVLLILILRSYINPEKDNLYIAFFIGLLTSHLGTTPLGLQSFIYVVVVQLTRVLSKAHVASALLTIIPLILFCLIFNKLVFFMLIQSSIQLWPKVLIEMLVAIPIYILLRFWEERFVVRSEIKLKL